MFYRIKTKILEDEDILKTQMYVGVEYRISNSSCWKDLIVDGIAVGFPIGEPISGNDDPSVCGLNWSGEKEAVKFMTDHFIGADDVLYVGTDSTVKREVEIDKNKQIGFLEIWKTDQDIRKRYFNYSAGSANNAPIPYFDMARDARSNLKTFDALCKEAYGASATADDSINEFRKVLNQTIAMVSAIN